MLYTAIGIDDDIDVEEALSRILQNCAQQLGGREPQVGILYTSNMEADHQALVTMVRRAYPQLQLIGCTTDGEITARYGFSEDGVALLLLGSNNLHFATSLARNISDNPEQSIREAFAQANRQLDQPPACAIVLPDGLTSIGIPLDMIIRQVMGDTFPVFGGLAADHFLLKTTYQFFGDEVTTDSMPILLIAGEVTLEASVYTGPKPYGPSYTIDSFDRNTIYRLDNRSIIDFYQEEYGQHTEMFTNFPLAVYPEDGDHYFLRNPILVDVEGKQIGFVGNFPPRCRVRLTQVLREDILHSAEEANRKLLQSLEERRPDLILIFSCTARRHVLGSETANELRLLREAAPPVPFFGFYCYGEIAPFDIGLPVRFHNETFAAVAFYTGASLT